MDVDNLVFTIYNSELLLGNVMNELKHIKDSFFLLGMKPKGMSCPRESFDIS